MTVTEHIREQTGAAAGSWALVEAAKGGDREAFAQLYRDYGPKVAGFVRPRVRGDRHLAEDLTSETFLRALRRIDSVSDQGRDVGAWFTTIARNLITDHYKSSRARREVAFEELPELRRPDNDASDTEALALDRYGRAAAAVTVEAALAGLTPDQRRVIELYDLAPHGRRQIHQTAAELGRGVAAAKSLRNRALRAMAERLTADGLTSSARCVEAVEQAREAVEHVAAQRRAPAAAARRRTADRWAGESVADAVETAGAGVTR